MLMRHNEHTQSGAGCTVDEGIRETPKGKRPALLSRRDSKFWIAFEQLHEPLEFIQKLLGNHDTRFQPIVFSGRSQLEIGCRMQRIAHLSVARILAIASSPETICTAPDSISSSRRSAS